MSIISTKLGNVLRAKGTDFDPRSDIPASDTQSAIEYLRATIAALSGVYQPLDSDLTAIAALATTTYGRSLLTLADLAALVAALDPSFLTPAEGNAAYQPIDSDLTAIAALATTTFGRALLTMADAAATRTTLALGTIATQNANSVTITGGAVTGITDIAIADGGTGASTATAGFDALAPTTTRGDIIFRNATVNARLAAGTAGYRLQTNGASADPTWVVAREFLTAARTYYVRTDGSNSNTGLVNSSGGAFLTIQKALDVILGTLDLAGNNVTITVAAGTYTGAVSFASPQVGSGNITISGDTTTPSNVVISTTADAIVVDGGGCRLFVEGVKVTSSAASGLVTKAGGYLKTTGKNELAGAAGFRFLADGGGVIEIGGNEIISGTATAHYGCGSNGFIYANLATSWTASGTATQIFAYCVSGIISGLGNTSSGTFVGQRYNGTLNGVINSNGGGANYFPGNSVGSTATGGQYA